MKTDITKYKSMIKDDLVPNDILMASLDDGHDEQESMKILVKVCEISKAEAQKTFDCFLQYRKVWLEGNNPKNVYKLSKNNGLDFLANIRLLRNLCKLDLKQAKEVIVTVDHDVSSLSEYQEKIVLPGLEKAITEDENQN